MFDCFDRAYAAIEKYKGDEETYNTLKRRINVEWIFPAFVAINNFENEFSENAYVEMKSKFKAICNEEGISYWTERIPLSSILENM